MQSYQKYNQTSNQELSATINLANKAYSTSNKASLKNIQSFLEEQGIYCVILQGELVGVNGELSWLQKPGSAYRTYYYNTN
jgi:hypothetical protein